MLVKIKDACEVLQVSRTTLYGLIKAGTIRAVPIGSRGVRIPDCEIERFIRNGLDEPVQDANEKAGY